jgi:hypothetical protein
MLILVDIGLEVKIATTQIFNGNNKYVKKNKINNKMMNKKNKRKKIIKIVFKKVNKTQAKKN